MGCNLVTWRQVHLDHTADQLSLRIEVFCSNHQQMLAFVFEVLEIHSQYDFLAEIKVYLTFLTFFKKKLLLTKTLAASAETT